MTEPKYSTTTWPALIQDAVTRMQQQIETLEKHFKEECEIANDLSHENEQLKAALLHTHHPACNAASANNPIGGPGCICLTVVRSEFATLKNQMDEDVLSKCQKCGEFRGHGHQCKVQEDPHDFVIKTLGPLFGMDWNCGDELSEEIARKVESRDQFLHLAIGKNILEEIDINRYKDDNPNEEIFWIPWARKRIRAVIQDWIGEDYEY